MADETQQAVKEVKKGASSFFLLISKYFQNLYQSTLVAIWRSYLRLNLAGKILAPLSFVAFFVITGFAFENAIEYEVTTLDQIVITSKRGHLRSATNIKSRSLASLKYGTVLQRKGDASEWWYVNSPDLDTSGWISKNIGKHEYKKTLSIHYEMEGYFLGMLGSLFLLLISFKIKKKS